MKVVGKIKQMFEVVIGRCTKERSERASEMGLWTFPPFLLSLLEKRGHV